MDFEDARTRILDERSPWIDVIHPTIPHFRYSANADNMTSPRVFKSHLHHFLLPDELKQGKGKIIALARNPAAVSVSYYKLMNYMAVTQFTDTLEEYLSRFLADGVIFGPWWLHVLQFWEHRRDENVLFLTYEELVSDKKGHIRKIAEFLGKTLNEDDVEKISDHTDQASMKDNDSVNWKKHEQMFKTDSRSGAFINGSMVNGFHNDIDISPDIRNRMADMVRHRLGHTDLKY